MKKLFFIAAIAALMMVSCTKEKGTDGPDDGGIKGNTYASFSFGGVKTRLVTDFNPANVLENDVNDGLIDVGDLYIIIFNAGGEMEFFAEVDANPYTALVKAGVGKRIFILANMGGAQTAANVNNHLVEDAINGSQLGPITVDGLEGLTLAEFYKVAFDAGIPQPFDVTKSSASRTFSVLPLSTRVAAGTYGLPMSNSNEYTFTFAPNVTEDDAKNSGTTPVYQGGETNNRFEVQLDYLGAKARLVMNVSTLPQTIANIDQSSATYTIKNLAKYTSLVQNVVSGNGRSIFHAYNWGTNPVQSDFQEYFDQASNADYIEVLTSQEKQSDPGAKSHFIFVPENTHQPSLLRGQSSFYAMNLTYKPLFIVESYTWQPLSSSIVYNYDEWDNVKALGSGNDHGLEGGDTYIYDPVGVENGGEVAKFFANKQVYADAVYYSGGGTLAAYNAAAVLAQVWDGTTSSFIAPYDRVKLFKDAQSWYRIDIGSGTSPNITYGVLRGTAYTAIISDITGPGEPTEPDLFIDPEIPVEAVTYINVTIKPATWTHVTQVVPVE